MSASRRSDVPDERFFDELMWDFCGNRQCVSLLSRDKRNRSPRAVLVRSVTYHGKKSLGNFVSRWSSVGIR